MTIHKHYVDLKSIKKNTTLVDPYFPSKYGFSPYRACQHGCKYCDGRAEKYYVDGDFEKDIVIRKNVPDLLDRQLSKYREKAIIGMGSGVSDPYQPVESDERLMRKCANVIAAHQFPAYVMTKSALILEDIDLWEEVHKTAGFTLYVSLTFADDAPRKTIEPGASSVEKRLEMLKTVKERGIFAGVLAMPFIPYISDTEENITALYEKLQAINVDFAIPGCLTLRPGKQKDIFLDVLQSHFPELHNKYETLYHKNLKSGAPTYAYRQQFAQRVNAIQEKFRIPWLVPHHVYKNQFPLYDEIYILLNHMQSLYARDGVDISPLNAGLKNYTDWFLEEKKRFNRRRNLDQSYLEEKLISLIRFNQFEEIIGNEKLTEFIKEIVIDRKTFDYMELKTV